MLKCPANYFGKGEDYILPEDRDVIREYERQFQEWESTHPDDPTGEIALAHAKSLGSPTVEKAIPQQQRVRVSEDSEPVQIEEDSQDMAELELTLPPNEIRLLKNYARFKRKRPRDIVMAWIQQFCKL